MLVLGVARELRAACTSYDTGRVAAIMFDLAHASVLLLAGLALACWLDLRSRRISNVLTLSLLLVGLALQATLPQGEGLLADSGQGSIGLSRTLLGIGSMFAAALALWRSRLFGAGDAKLLIAVAAFVGWPGVAPLLLLTVASGTFLAFWGVWRRRRNRGTPYMTDQRAGSTALSLPYSLAITAGTIAYILLQNQGLLRW